MAESVLAFRVASSWGWAGAGSAAGGVDVAGAGAASLDAAGGVAGAGSPGLKPEQIG